MKKTLTTLIVSFLYLACYSQIFDAELANTKTDIVLSNGKLIKTKFFEIKINNRNGEKFAKVSVPYSKNNKISNLEAYVKNSLGEIVRKLRKDEITDRSDISYFSLYEDDFVKEFTLKHNVFPYYICYSYQTQQTEFIHIENWFPVLDTEIPTKNAELSLTIPKGYLFRFNVSSI